MKKHTGNDFWYKLKEENSKFLKQNTALLKALKMLVEETEGYYSEAREKAEQAIKDNS